MTKEQEAIERCKSIVRVNKDFLKGNKQTINQEEIDCIETVLNMLKEKDKEIERLEYIKKSFDYVAQKEIENKDKQINLMAEQIKISEPTMKIESFDIKPKTKFSMRYLNKEEVKQYFERKVKNEH